MSPKPHHALAHAASAGCVSLWAPHSSADSMRQNDTVCEPSTGLSGTQDSPLSVRLHYSAFHSSRPYHLAVCPLASSFCLPTWLAFSSGNKGGVQFWVVPGSHYPTPTPFPFQEHRPSLSQADPWLLRGPFPQFQGEERLSSLLAPPFSHPLAPNLVPSKAPKASLVWAGGSSSPHCLARIWKLWFP